ncbi:hypothetical protein JOE68_003347 [Saccharothrix algeriensis]|uniref:Uncharacterized protein n=1 Tax=Saccharothrix algeriensis TaxID=173560 RepID=A0ABS2S8B1_9PSEU|nr:hypothetical protein [Saccharothrix algeriensis]
MEIRTTSIDYRDQGQGRRFDQEVDQDRSRRTDVAAALMSRGDIADQLGHSRLSMTQDLHPGRKVVDRRVASALEGAFGEPTDGQDDGQDQGDGEG